MVKLWGQDKGGVRAGRRPAGYRPAGGWLRHRARTQPVSCPAAGSVRVVSGIRVASGIGRPAASGSSAASGQSQRPGLAVRGPDLAGFAADDLGQYRVGPALDAESRRSQ